MKNPFKNTAFLFGITKYQKLPEDTGTEILLSGRSNAGKSSALNALTKNKKLARIAKLLGGQLKLIFLKWRKVSSFLICLAMGLQNLVTLEEKIGARC